MRFMFSFLVHFLSVCLFCCYPAKPATLRRRSEKKETVPDKRSLLFPAVAKEVQGFINAKRKEARGMVLSR